MRCFDSLRRGCFMPRARRGRNGAGVGNAWVHHWLAVEVGGTLESSVRKAWHEKVKSNQTRPACCSVIRKGWDKKVTSSVICADQNSRHLLSSTIQSRGLQLLFLGSPMIPLS